MPQYTVILSSMIMFDIIFHPPLNFTASEMSLLIAIWNQFKFELLLFDKLNRIKGVKWRFKEEKKDNHVLLSNGSVSIEMETPIVAPAVTERPRRTKSM